jgi:hypothetical protein
MYIIEPSPTFDEPAAASGDPRDRARRRKVRR